MSFYVGACIICGLVQAFGIALAVHCYLRERMHFHLLAAASRACLLVWLVGEVAGPRYAEHPAKAFAILIMAGLGFMYQWSATRHLARRITTILPGKNGELHFIASTLPAPMGPDDEVTERLPPYRKGEH